jgi:hypothetical protein
VTRVSGLEIRLELRNVALRGLQLRNVALCPSPLVLAVSAAEYEVHRSGTGEQSSDHRGRRVPSVEGVLGESGTNRQGQAVGGKPLPAIRAVGVVEGTC